MGKAEKRGFAANRQGPPSQEASPTEDRTPRIEDAEDREPRIEDAEVPEIGRSIGRSPSINGGLVGTRLRHSPLNNIHRVVVHCP